VLSLALAAATARALAPPSPWDGVNPFRCTIQDAGQGSSVPDPSADPYCVHFDKTNQNITELGFVAFLSQEPARVAAASPKCFYFQEDHWRGSVVQSDQRTVIYEFIGHYYFNKATGDGGVWVTGFTVAGETYDPSALPGFPPQYGPFFGPGTGGFTSHNDVPTDPSCAARAQHAPGSVYAPSHTAPRCVPASGHVDRKHVGPLALGTTEDRVRAELGPPQAIKRGFLHYCVSHGGNLLVGQPGDRSGTFGSGGHAPTVILLTTARGFELRASRGRRVTVGSSTRALARAFPHAVRLLRLGHTTVEAIGPIRGASGRAASSAGTIIAGIAHGRVRYLGVYDTRVIRTLNTLASYLRRGT
jgi:hypothetical protein